MIVPGLGGFMAHHVEARYDESDMLFLPPIRTIGFNSKLSMNDSLLAQSYVEAYDISFPDAQERIAQEVAELKAALDDEGQYELNDIGVLSINEEGSYQFEPCEAGILTPDLYGLCSFGMKKWSLPDSAAEEAVVSTQHASDASSRRKVEEKPAFVEVPIAHAPLVAEAEAVATEPVSGNNEHSWSGILPSVDDSEDGKTIHIKVSVVRNIFAVAVSVIMFFILAPTINQNVPHGVNMSSVKSGVVCNLLPADVAVVTPDMHLSKEDKGAASVRQVRKDNAAGQGRAVVIDNTETPASAGESKEPVQAKDKVGYYSVVLAARITRHNAEAFVASLHGDGCKDARVIDNGEVVRVVCGQYASEAQAQQRMQQMRAQKAFKDCWILHVND